ncbi:MAG: TIGR03862 family flavoprotein [Marinosulfonomonas sp.]|nr:TIGR03862 family flavoprotein [Marinosulfonomonas sp.]
MANPEPDRPEPKQALIIGGGPAGLMAAEMLTQAGLRVVVADAMPTVGRKFLMAGRSGLNLTKDEDFDLFMSRYEEQAPWLLPMIRGFDGTAVQDWAHDLGQEVFTGSSGRVFPKAMKASPLLRSWLRRLGDAGVQFQTRWKWLGWQGDAVVFDTPNGQKQMTPDVTILALGGASWSRLGSDGKWVDQLKPRGVELTKFAPANAGLSVNWSPHMHRYFASPVKGVALQAGNCRTRGEFVISNRGLEGGGIYALSKAVREGATVSVDLMPDWPLDRVAQALGKPRGKLTWPNYLRRVLRLNPVKIALLMEFGGPLNENENLPATIKNLPIRHSGLRPIDEAISVAGGVAEAAVTDGLMLKEIPGVFVAGEMLDWEAPTGGYLISACLATGRWAGKSAAEWIANSDA